MNSKQRLWPRAEVSVCYFSNALNSYHSHNSEDPLAYAFTVYRKTAEEYQLKSEVNHGLPISGIVVILLCLVLLVFILKIYLVATAGAVIPNLVYDTYP